MTIAVWCAPTPARYEPRLPSRHRGPTGTHRRHTRVQGGRHWLVQDGMMNDKPFLVNTLQHCWDHDFGHRPPAMGPRRARTVSSITPWWIKVYILRDFRTPHARGADLSRGAREQMSPRTRLVAAGYPVAAVLEVTVSTRARQEAADGVSAAANSAPHRSVPRALAGRPVQTRWTRHATS